MKIIVIIASVLINCCFATLSGQSVGEATLYGKAILEENEAAIGAYLTLNPGNLQAVSDLDGNFIFTNLAAGDYELLVSYVGTKDKVLPVSLAAGESKSITVELLSDAAILAQATVIGRTQAREQQDRALKIESVEMRTVVSRVKDVAEVIQRLPGVNVRGSGSFGDPVDITLNGLNGTAVRTLLDGLPLEFIAPQFTINNIPVNSIARVDVYKGVVPIDIGADALGGAVNVISAQSDINELQASYSYGSFNTHQANVSGSYKIAEGVSIGANVTYNYSDNDFTHDAQILDLATGRNETQEISRFHDAYRLTFGTLNLNISNKKWTDRFRISANANEYYKEVQNGNIIGNFPFGEVFYDGGGWSISGLYEKTLGDKLKFVTNTAVSRVNVIFVDTTANDYQWDGSILRRVEGQRGELVAAQNSDRDFDNIANRTTLVWTPNLRNKIMVSNLFAGQSNIGRDFETSVERDAFAREQSNYKNVIGLEYQRLLLQDKLTLTAAGKYYIFDLDGVDPSTLLPVSTSGNDIGYYATAKYNVTDRFFLRASYENALRIPTADQFFGNGANVGQNLLLNPETSDNYNLGFSFSSPQKKSFRFLIAGSGFIRQQMNLIFLNANSFPRFINADNVGTLGGEISSTIWYGDHFKLNVNATRLRQNYGEISSLDQSEFLEGTPFPNVPKWFYNARLSYVNRKLIGDGNSFSAYVQHKYVDEFNFNNISTVITEDNLVPVQRRTDLGISLTFQDGKYGVAANANNIFNADVFDNFSVPRPRRNFNIRLSYNFQDL